MSTINDNRAEKIFVATKDHARSLIQSSSDLVQISKALGGIADSVSKTDLVLALKLIDLDSMIIEVSGDINRANQLLLAAWTDTE